MQIRPLRQLASFLFLAAAAGCGSTPVPGTSTPVADAGDTGGAALIRAEDLYDRIAFLSADSLGGRDTPSRGLETAAAYLVAQHQALGLLPGGETETYYQRYPFLGRRQTADGTVVQEESFPSNVVAILPGSDPELRDEYVVLSAHYDHVGIGTPVGGDSIYNGADDNATGTATLLEVAEAFASLETRPRRSLMFLHVSGEEHGLRGSDWFADHPTVPVDQIVANINVDMIGRNTPDTIVVIGKEYSSLGDVVNRAGGTHPDLGLVVADDKWPQERFFFRSDHFNFARVGVPAVFFFAGVHEDYHRPSDEIDKIDTDKTRRVAKLIYYTVEAIANADERPVWDPRGLQEVQRLTR